jgi:hypothetical protein
MKNKIIKNSGMSPLKLSVVAFVLATFCTAAQAQIVSEVSRTNLGDGAILDSVFSSSTTNPQDPDVFVQLTGVKGDTAPTRHKGWVTISGGYQFGPAATVLAAYATLAGAVTPKYATYILSANGVLVEFSQGDPERPIVNGSVYNGVKQTAISKAVEVSSPSSLQGGLAGFQSLLAQFSFASPFAPAPSAACSGIATQLDVDANGNLLVHIFQSNLQPFIGVTVTVFVSLSGGNPAQFQAVSDSNGLAQFNGPGNTVTLTAQTSITAMELQFSNAGAPAVCAIQLQVSSCSTTTDLGALMQSSNVGELLARPKKEADLISELRSGISKSQTTAWRPTSVSVDSKFTRANAQ